MLHEESSPLPEGTDVGRRTSRPGSPNALDVTREIASRRNSVLSESSRHATEKMMTTPQFFNFSEELENVERAHRALNAEKKRFNNSDELKKLKGENIDAQHYLVAEMEEGDIKDIEKIEYRIDVFSERKRQEVSRIQKTFGAKITSVEVALQAAREQFKASEEYKAAKRDFYEEQNEFFKKYENAEKTLEAASIRFEEKESKSIKRKLVRNKKIFEDTEESKELNRKSQKALDDFNGKIWNTSRQFINLESDFENSKEVRELRKDLKDIDVDYRKEIQKKTQEIEDNITRLNEVRDRLSSKIDNAEKNSIKASENLRKARKDFEASEKYLKLKRDVSNAEKRLAEKKNQASESLTDFSTKILVGDFQEDPVQENNSTKILQNHDDYKIAWNIIRRYKEEVNDTDYPWHEYYTNIKELTSEDIKKYEEIDKWIREEFVKWRMAKDKDE